MEALIETWQIHNRIHLFLLEAISAEQLTTKLAKGKSVDAQFAHIHNVRLMWIKAAAPDLLPDLAKLEAGADAATIEECLNSSANVITQILRNAGSPEGRIKNFKPHAAAFVGYMIAHESNHRGHIEIALRQAGSPVSDKVGYGLWEWGVR